jgi:hypothetical protein
MNQEPSTHRVQILLHNRVREGYVDSGGPGPGGGAGRLWAIGALALLYVVMISVWTQSFTPRAEWQDTAGRVLLEDRPVFWPLLLFAVLGRFATGLAVWYPRIFDPTKGFFPVVETPSIRRRRVLFWCLYLAGLSLAAWTLVNNLALTDVLGVAKAVAIGAAIVLGIGLVARLAVLAALQRLANQLRR